MLAFIHWEINFASEKWLECLQKILHEYKYYIVLMQVYFSLEYPFNINDVMF